MGVEDIGVRVWVRVWVWVSVTVRDRVIGLDWVRVRLGLEVRCWSVQGASERRRGGLLLLHLLQRRLVRVRARTRARVGVRVRVIGFGFGFGFGLGLGLG